MQNNKRIWIALIIVIILAVGGYLIFHKSPKSTNSNTASSTYSSTTSPNNTATKSADIIQTETESGIGQYLADSSGSALYTYSGDTKGVSNCTGSCLYSWPAYSPTTSSESALPANVTIITRNDGTKQYAYNGLPLYTFVNDPSGQVTGDGISGFKVAKP